MADLEKRIFKKFKLYYQKECVMSYDQFKMTFIKKGTKIQFFNHLENIVERVYKDEKIWPFQGNNIVRLSKIATHITKRMTNIITS